MTVPAADALAVLVVDDEPQVVEHLSAGLELMGYATRRAGSAAEAMMRLAEDAAIGVVITDIRMPGGDGLSLAQDILRGKRGGSPVQVVLITGHATLDDATAALRAGVSDMLRKPFRLAEAAAAVDKAMQAARAERSAARIRADESARIAGLERDRDALAARLDQALARLGTVATVDTRVSEHIRHEASAISHALRTPLNAISGGAELMAFTGAGGFEGNLRMLRGGVLQAIRAIELVEELYRTESQPGDLPRSRVVLPAALSDTLSVLAGLVADKALTVQVDASEPDIALDAPMETLRRILAHVLEAAVDWSCESGTLSVRLSREVQDGTPHCVVVVASAPPGAAPPTLDVGATGSGSVLSRTQEDLHFAIARRLIAGLGGTLVSRNDGARAMAIRLALPG